MNRAPGPRLLIVILAGGASTRFGRPKALARLRGVSLLRRAATLALSLGAAGVEVIVPPRRSRYREELRRTAARAVANPHTARGLSSSVRLAVTRARHASAVLIVPVDLARLERRDLARLVAAWRAARRRIAARCADGRPVTPLILPKRLYEAARTITGDAGLKDLIGRLPAERVALLELPSAATDVDTPGDLADARRRARSR